jgi:hypothetical protein
MSIKSLDLSKNNLLSCVRNKLIVNGQGIIVFKNENNECECMLFIYNKYHNDGLKVEFLHDELVVTRISNNNKLVDINNSKGLSYKKGAYYWFSLDTQNQRLYAGIGEARLDNVIYKYDLSHDFKLFLESLTEIKVSEESKYIKLIKLLRDPITMSVPLLVKDTHELTMVDIAKGDYLPKANLSIVSQKLYDCISGKKFILDDSDFPDFSKAIEYSIKTPGLWCNTKLKDKSTEFNKDKPNILETYLRITLGENNGESPGIPYVMEIWPVGHYSPIHSHGNSNAIIRVLHGKIHVKLFPFLCEDGHNVEPFAEKIFSKNDITWISPTLNQVHQLVNDSSNLDTCITIQCYMYDNENTTHYDYFDYIDGDGKVEQYEPDSDMDFIKFREIIMEEWNNRQNNIKKNILKFDKMLCGAV